MIEPKKPVKIGHLVKWYFGNFCARCKRIEMEEERYGRNCYENLQAIGNSTRAAEMTHKEFVAIVKSGPFCRPIKRIFSECPICKKFGIPQRR